MRMADLIPAGLAAPELRAVMIAVLLLVGALGKIGADSRSRRGCRPRMAGPTPVSALLHFGHDGRRRRDLADPFRAA